MIKIKKNGLVIIVLTVLVLLVGGCGGGADISYYDLEIKTIGQGTVSPESNRYKKNEKVKLHAIPKEGWVFSQWQGGIDGTAEDCSLIIDSDYNITAVFEKITCKGTVNVSNKTAVNISNSNPKQFKMASQSLDLNKNLNLWQQQYKAVHKTQEILIKYKANLPVQAVAAIEEKNNLQLLNKVESYNGEVIHYQLPPDQTVKKAVQKYEKQAEVEFVQPNYTYYASQIPNDNYYKAVRNEDNIEQWGAVSLNLEAAWDQNTGDSNVSIAVIDTGIVPNHVDLESNISFLGYDFVENDYEPYDLTGKIEGAYFGSHGTHVAGIVGAVGNNLYGVAGTNWSTNIVPIRVLNRRGEGTTLDISRAIKYAAGIPISISEHKTITIPKKVDIINLSLGGKIADNSHDDKLLKEAIKQAHANGVLIFAAAGNNYQGPVSKPAAYDKVVAVGAVNKKLELSDFSNCGPNLDLVAPGEEIYSTWGYCTNFFEQEFVRDYEKMAGTSMATPYVSGVAALLLSQGTRKDKVINQLQKTAVDLGTKGQDEQYGYGLVDAYGAMLEQKLAAPKVFVAVKEKEDLIIKSAIKTTPNNDRYQLGEVNADEEVYIVGWRNVNNNSQVDHGDYYGQVGPVLLSDEIQQQDLQLNYVGSETKGVPFNNKNDS